MYRAVVYENNQIEITDIQVTAGKETRVRADWGKLTLFFNEPGKYAKFFDSNDKNILGSNIKKGGRLSCYVKSGDYIIQVFVDPRKEYRNLVVQANKETIAGDFVNHPPEITNVSGTPSLVKAGKSAGIRVSAKDDDGDQLEYAYEPNIGRIEGTGSQVVYHAPVEAGTYRIRITVSDPHGGKDSFDYYISGGDLTVRTLTGHNDPFSGYVAIYNELGKRVAGDNVGGDGVRTWRLREGSYRLQIHGNNMIEVPEVNVVTDLDAYAIINFGKLIVESFGVDNYHLNTYILVKDQKGKKVAGGQTGKDGHTAFNLHSGTYKVIAYRANEIERPDIVIDSQKEYLVVFNPSDISGSAVAEPTISIEQIVVKPVKTERERTFDIKVILSRETAKEYKFEYKCSGGHIIPSVNTARVTASGRGPISIQITVSSSQDQKAQGAILIPQAQEQ